MSLLTDIRYYNKNLPTYIAIAEGDTATLRAEKIKLEQDPSTPLLDLLYSEYWMDIICNRDKEAYHLLTQIHTIENDSLMELCRRGNNLKDVEKNYQNQKIDSLEGRLGNYRVRMGVGASLSLMLIIGLLYLWHRNRKRMRLAVYEKERVVSELMNENRDLRLGMEESSAAISEAEVLLKQQFSTINSVCYDYYEKRDAGDKVKLSILNDIETHFSKLASKEFLDRLEVLLDKQYGGAPSALTEILHNPKKYDRALLLLDIAGLSAKTISVACGFNDSSYFYNRRRKLRQKISASGHPSAEKLMELLHS